MVLPMFSSSIEFIGERRGLSDPTNPVDSGAPGTRHVVPVVEPESGHATRPAAQVELAEWLVVLRLELSLSRWWRICILDRDAITTGSRILGPSISALQISDSSSHWYLHCYLLLHKDQHNKPAYTPMHIRFSA